MMTNDEKYHFVGWCILEKKMTREELAKKGRFSLFILLQQFRKWKKERI